MPIVQTFIFCLPYKELKLFVPSEWSIQLQAETVYKNRIVVISDSEIFSTHFSNIRLNELVLV